MSRDNGRELRKVDLTWPPEKIRQFCELEDYWVLELDASMSPSELEALYQRQVGVADPYIGLIAEIAEHANTPPQVLVDCARRFRSSAEVMSSLALRLDAEEALLVELSSHEHETVREHALQALRRRHNG